MKYKIIFLIILLLFLAPALSAQTNIHNNKLTVGDTSSDVALTLKLESGQTVKVLVITDSDE